MYIYFKSLDKYLGYKCMGYVDKKDKKGVATLINGNVTLFEGLDVIQAMAISVDYNQFLKLPLSAFEDEKVLLFSEFVALQSLFLVVF